MYQLATRVFLLKDYEEQVIKIVNERNKYIYFYYYPD